MPNTDNTSVGKPAVGGAISVAPVGTPLPASATEQLNSAFQNLGYISEDGLVNNNTAESDKIKAWGGDTVIVLQTSKEDTYQFTLIEILSLAVLKFVYGDDNVTGTLDSGIKVKANNAEAEERSIVIDMMLKGNVAKRIVIAKGKISEVGEITYADEDAIGYQTTVTCLPDDEGNTHIEYIKKLQSVNHHTVTFQSNGGSNVGNQIIADGETATEPEDPEKSGYTFDGWYLSTDLSTPYDFSAAVTTDITLLAKWTEV